jgi:hypothetical protein
VPCSLVNVYRRFGGNERSFVRIRRSEDLISHSAVMLFGKLADITCLNCANDNLTCRVVSILISMLLAWFFFKLMCHVFSFPANVNKKTRSLFTKLLLTENQLVSRSGNKMYIH